ncbi:hypothetical protein C2845_PM17G04350 [Panicum miliaceum]|uniref:RNase H type-1 domain-containing protein n=1 Tax=Panicum miliaceum TaxID=4540 RepID=A0A3L6Q3C5_PANMI|nr:hypothetical protein C2845_PM17G04350 [Panicum miliaceum]
MQLLGYGSAREVATAVLQLDQERRRLVICLMWARWMNRNKANAGESAASVDEVVRKAINFANCAYELEDKPKQAPKQGRRVTEHWHPPPSDVLKINIDGAFHETDKSGAWGFLIRDCDGHGVLAGAGRLRAVHDALTAEGEACMAALKEAMELGISQAVIETNLGRHGSMLQAFAVAADSCGPGVDAGAAELTRTARVEGRSALARRGTRSSRALARRAPVRTPQRPDAARAGVRGVQGCARTRGSRAVGAGALAAAHPRAGAAIALSSQCSESASKTSQKTHGHVTGLRQKWQKDA